LFKIYFSYYECYKDAKFDNILIAIAKNCSAVYKY